MRRRHLQRALAGIAVAAIGLLLVLLGLVLRDPSSYAKAGVAEGEERRRLSGEFQSAVFQMMPGSTTESGWQETFTAEQINSYFAEDFLRAKPFELPAGVHSPRVRIATDSLELSFRYGKGFWSSVVSINMKIWLVAAEPNTIAVEILRTRAGTLPLSLRSFIERYLRSNRDWNVDVTWYRHQGRPVALVRLNGDPQRAPLLLQRLELQDGQLFLAGRKSTDLRVSLLP